MAHAGKLWTRGLVAAAVLAVGGGVGWVVWRQPAVQMALLELDLAGRIDRHAGGKVSLRSA